MKEFALSIKLFMLFTLLTINFTVASQTLNITVVTDKTRYMPQEEVTINGTVTLNGNPVLDAAVAIEVDNETSGEIYFFRSRPTSTNIATQWPAEITDVYLSDEYSNPKNSTNPGSWAYFTIKIRNNEETPKNVTIIPYFQMGLTPLPIEIVPSYGNLPSGIVYNKTLGKTYVGTLTDSMSGDKKFASCFQLEIPTTYHANVTKISWRGTSPQPAHAKAIIYRANSTNGTPQELVATSQETIITSTTQWWNFTFNPQAILTAGYYWIGIISDAQTLYYTYDPGYLPELNASRFAYNDDLYSDGPSATFGTPTYQNRSMDIFATYNLVQDCGMFLIRAYYIPENTPAGTATIFVSLLKDYYPSCLPKYGGTVYCPEKAANFTIINPSTGYSETPPPDGYYQVRFNSSVGNYTVYVSCSYQDQTATNMLTFIKTFRGDVNLDFKVEGKDVAIVAKAYDTQPGDPLWDPRADLNGDGRVEGKDFAIVAKDYGSHA
ncbi:MAG: dockerin type I domain-containing protein [Candidatus Bathyarchaeales archaeon]